MIMRDVNYGWLIRYMHANVASFFFIFVYLHIGRGLYYGSYRAPRTLLWSIGVIILVLMIAIAFLGLNIAPESLIFLSLTFTCSRYISSFSFPSFGPKSPYSDRLQAWLTKNNIKPLSAWEGLDQTVVQKEIKKTLKSVAGIYLIIDLATGEHYFGSGRTGRIYQRFASHLIRGDGSKRVAAALEKDGLSNFAFVLVETVPATVDSESVHYLLTREDYYLALLPVTFNVTTSATSPWDSEEIRIYQSDNSAMYYLVQPLDHSAAPVVLRTLPSVAYHCNCSEKTVRRALSSNGIIKKTWQVGSLGKRNLTLVPVKSPATCIGNGHW